MEIQDISNKENNQDNEQQIEEKKNQSYELLSTSYLSISKEYNEEDYHIKKRIYEPKELPNLKREIKAIKNKDFEEIYENIIEEMKKKFQIKIRKKNPKKRKH